MISDPTTPSPCSTASRRPTKDAAAARHVQASSSTSAAAPPVAAARPLSSAAKALVEKAAKQAAAVQIGLGFGAIEKYPAGLKILLPDTIYKYPSVVSGV